MFSGLVSALYNNTLRSLYRFRFWKRVDGVAVYLPVDRRARALFTDNNAVAFALGLDVYARSMRAFTKAVSLHERKHVQQYRKEGVMFFWRYWRASQKYGYSANPYERAARRAEGLRR